MAACCISQKTRHRVCWRLKLAEYEYEVVYKAGRINANADALSRNPVSILPLRISEKSESTESLFPVNLSKRRKVRKDDTISDNEPERTRPENSIGLTKTNNGTESKRSESPSRDINSDTDTRTLLILLGKPSRKQ